MRSLLSTPNQVASVAKYWSQAVVGIQRPVLTVVGPADGKRREIAVGFLAVDGAAHDHMVAAPTVVAAQAVGRESSPEITASKRRHPLAETRIVMQGKVADLVHRGLKGEHALAQLSKQVGMSAVEHRAAVGNIGLSGVQVIATHGAEENLAFHAEAAIGDAAVGRLQ